MKYEVNYHEANSKFVEHLEINVENALKIKIWKKAKNHDNYCNGYYLIDVENYDNDVSIHKQKENESLQLVSYYSHCSYCKHIENCSNHKQCQSCDNCNQECENCDGACGECESCIDLEFTTKTKYERK